METAESTLDLIRSDVMAWRRAHGGRRGPLPMDLRNRAGVVAQFFGEDLVAKTLDIAPSLLTQWGDRSAAAEDNRTRVRQGSPASFVDVGRDLVATLAHRPAGSTMSASPWAVEVIKPCGTTIRIQGPVDSAALMALVHGARL